MPRQNEKTHLLDTAGYVYNLDRMMYINREAKKAFSYEFVDDNPESEIESRMQEPRREEGWQIYTNLPMSEGTWKELQRVLQ